MSARKRKAHDCRPIRVWWERRRAEITKQIRLASLLSDNDRTAMNEARAAVIAKFDAMLTPTQIALYNRLVDAKQLPPTPIVAIPVRTATMRTATSIRLGPSAFRYYAIDRRTIAWDEVSEFDPHANPNGVYRRKDTRVLKK